jgi:hypothetical protein
MRYCKDCKCMTDTFAIIAEESKVYESCMKCGKYYDEI